jgi:hypothetical protein
VPTVLLWWSSTNIYKCLTTFFYCAWLPSYRNHLHWDSNPRQIFGVMTFVSIISSLKHTKLISVPIFLLCLVPSYMKHHRDSNPGCILTEVFVIFLSLPRARMLKQTMAVPCHILTYSPSQ